MQNSGQGEYFQRGREPKVVVLRTPLLEARKPEDRSTVCFSP